MPKSNRYLHIRMRMERDKLVSWAVLNNLSEDERTLSPSLRLNQHKINSSLQEIRLVLFDLAKSRFQQCELGPAKTDNGDGDVDDASGVIALRPSYTLEKKAIRFISSTRRFPRQLRWTGALALDKELKMALAKLTALNDGIAHFLERQQHKRYLQMQQDMLMGILQTRNEFEELLDLRAALDAIATYMPTTVHDQRLLSLVRFKAFHVAIDGARSGFDEDAVKAQLGDAPTRSKWVLLDSGRISTRSDDGLENEPPRTCGIYENMPVWVDWKYCTYIRLALVKPAF